MLLFVWSGVFGERTRDPGDGGTLGTANLGSRSAEYEETILLTELAGVGETWRVETQRLLRMPLRIASARSLIYWGPFPSLLFK